MEEPGVESLRQVAANWSLDGDHKLLDILQNTHQRIISKCSEVSDHLNSMVTSLDDASISLQNVNNRFMALSNSQFIESRVYDDDADVATETSPVKEPPKQSSLEIDIQSLKRGLEILETAHEALTILQDSDTDTESEDETAARTVLRPKDMYSDRPLPYVIGSQAWKNKWHAGLVCSDSDSDSSTSRRLPSQSEYSDSEPEPPPATRPQGTADVTISRSSSEHHSERSETPPPVIMKQTPADIAAELARRLGGQPPKIVEQVVDYEPAHTHRLYKPAQPTTGTVFPDEPPPLSDSSDSQDGDIFADLHKSQPYSSHQGVPDLFRFPQEQGGDGGSNEEGDIFSDFAKPVPDPNAIRRPPVFADQPNMFADQPNMFADQPNMFADQPNTFASRSQPVHNTKDTVDDGKSVKKPVGAISLFGNIKGAENIGAAILNRNRRRSSTSGDNSESDAPETQQRPEVQTKEKDIFDDLFAKSQKINKETNVVKDVKVVVTKKDDVKDKRVDLFSDNIFDDIDDIFTTNVVKKPEKTQKSIFDDEDDLFSDIAAPKSVKSDAKSSDSKKGLFDSDDDELFSDKIKSISKDSASAASDSTNINKRIQEITKIVEITKDTSKGSTITNNSSIIINKNNEEVTKKVETPNDSTKISNVFGDDSEEDMFSNIKTNEKKVQNKVSPKSVANLSKATTKATNSFDHPSLFGDNDDDLFATPQSTKHTEKDTAISNQAVTVDILENTDEDNLFAGATKSSNLTRKDTANDETDRVNKSENNNILSHENIKSSDIKDDSGDGWTKPEITIKKVNDDSANTKYTINSDAPKSVISHQRNNESDRNDFVQDCEDLPTTGENKTILNVPKTENKVAEKPSDIFDNTDDIFEKPAQKHKDNNINEDLNKTSASSSKIIVNIREIVTENIPEVSEKTYTQQNSKEDTHTTPISVNYGTVNKSSTKANKSTDRQSKTPEKDNNNAIFNDTDPHTSVFEDIFTEPPVFEKPKEPKRSKNVNALFDDDSDDEALFFKKNDVITDDKPDDFQLNQDSFDIFIDEPPDVNVAGKIGSDDELFGSLPEVTSTGNANQVKNEPKDIENKDQERIIDSEDDLFNTLPSPAIPRTGIETLDKTKVVGTDNLDISASKASEDAEDSIGDELSRNNKADLDDDLFKTLPKTAIKPSGSKTDGDDDLFRLPQNEKPATTLPKSAISPDRPKKHTTIGSKDDILSDDEELFKSPTKSEKNIASLPKTDTDKSKELISQSDDLSKSLPKDEAVTSFLKNEIKSNSDEELFKTLSNSDATLPQSPALPRETVEQNAEKSPKKVGKLKSMNFNINVNALLPGASPKKQKADPSSPKEPISKPDSKTQSADQESKNKSEQTDITENDSKDTTKLESNIEISDSKMVKSVAFEDEHDSGILDNKLSKERAKIQVKRRPSTRRARREAVRKSAIDLEEDSTDNSSSIDDPPKTRAQSDKHDPEMGKDLVKSEDLDITVKSTETSEKASPNKQTDDRDIPDNIQTRANDVNTENQPEITARPSSRDVNTKIVYVLNDEDIFNTPAVPNPGLNTLGNIYTEKNLDKNTATNMKIAITKKSKPEVDSVKKGIFDSDSDEELFTVKKEVKKVVKGPLFNDEDDDDLFGVKKKHNEPKPQASRSTAIREPQNNTEPVFDDPLSMMGDED